jgi:hypothetical protein
MKRGQTLVATLIVVVIIAILAVVLLGGTGMMGGDAPQRADGQGKTVVGGSLLTAKDEVCRSNLAHIRQSLQMTATLDEPLPDTLEDTRLGANFYRCPVGNVPYRYDSSSGQVGCPHPGHERH